LTGGPSENRRVEHGIVRRKWRTGVIAAEYDEDLRQVSTKTFVIAPEEHPQLACGVLLRLGGRARPRDDPAEAGHYDENFACGRPWPMARLQKNRSPIGFDSTAPRGGDSPSGSLTRHMIPRAFKKPARCLYAD
jgi:hypothetical protein